MQILFLLLCCFPCFALGICGDGIRDAGEQCDDGNAVGGDGCSATCKVETNYYCYSSSSIGRDVCVCAPTYFGINCQTSVTPLWSSSAVLLPTAMTLKLGGVLNLDSLQFATATVSSVSNNLTVSSLGYTFGSIGALTSAAATANLKVVSQISQISPAGTKLQKTATLTLGYQSELLSSSDDKQQLGIYFWNASNNIWSLMPSSNIDTTVGVVSVPISEFSLYAVLEPVTTAALTGSTSSSSDDKSLSKDDIAAIVMGIVGFIGLVAGIFFVVYIRGLQKKDDIIQSSPAAAIVMTEPIQPQQFYFDNRKNNVPITPKALLDQSAFRSPMSVLYLEDQSFTTLANSPQHFPIQVVAPRLQSTIK